MINNILEIIKLLKPKFYDKITWLIVVFGLGLITTPPVWLSLLNQVLKKFNYDTIPQNGNPLFGFLIVIIGLTYHVIITKNIALKSLESNEKRSHDIEIAKNLTTILDEGEFNVILDSLIGDANIHINELKKLDSFHEDCQKIQNQFLIADCESKKIAFVQSLIKLRQFILTEFFIWPTNQKQEDSLLCLRPNLDIDKEGDGEDETMDQFHLLFEELKSLAFEAERKFKDYRKSIKFNLKF